MIIFDFLKFDVLHCNIFIIQDPTIMHYFVLCLFFKLKKGGITFSVDKV